MNDPLVLKKHLDFIQRLGARYDGHPDVDHVDLGSIGWWGEWHLSGSKRCSLPTQENRMKVVDAYLAAFKKTSLVMLIGGEDCAKYAVQHGAGWRADCLGDMGGFSRRWCHMRNGYPGWFRAARLQDAWKTGPRRLGKLLGHEQVGERRMVVAVHIQLCLGLARFLFQQ